jgi:hypothetical protein
MKRMDSDLRAARLRAGFKSARSAALTFSWPESAYSAHESGTRRAPPEKMQQYLDAFSKSTSSAVNAISPRFSATPRDVVERLLRERRTQKLADRVVAGRRLMLSRRLAGFDTPTQAAEFYGWGVQNYYGHESGRRSIPRQTADKYGLAFGVSPAWLLRGEAPSGLSSGLRSTELDAIAERFASSNSENFPGEMLQLASADRRADTEIVSQFSSTSYRRKAPAKALSSEGDVLEVVREGLDSSANRAWGFPPAFLSQAWGITSDNLRMVGLTEDAAGVAAGDRILVDCNDVAVRDGHTFAMEREDGVIVLVRGLAEVDASRGLDKVLGRAAAVLQRLP